MELWSFLLAFLVPLLPGTVIIFRYFGTRGRLATALYLGLIGFAFFETALVAMLIDEKAAVLSWQDKLGFAALTGVGAVVVGLLNLAIFRRGLPFSSTTKS